MVPDKSGKNGNSSKQIMYEWHNETLAESLGIKDGDYTYSTKD
jgi:hypothetical protein